MSDLPWMIEAKKVMGLHEDRDRAVLAKWLKSDGKTLGDPSKLPWCGDFVDTAIELALPDEPRPGKLGENPYWALNWLLFGKACNPAYGAVVAFERPGGGHVGFLVGQDEKRFYVLGGNQGDTVSVTPIDRGRARGYRWPTTYKGRPGDLPQMKSATASSKNEA
jgi:uncharacterized protein (TIGR02594 family)